MHRCQPRHRRQYRRGCAHQPTCQFQQFALLDIGHMVQVRAQHNARQQDQDQQRRRADQSSAMVAQVIEGLADDPQYGQFLPHA
jgi:hypothetical protein